MLAARIGTQHPAAWIFPHKCIARGLIYNALHWSILQPTPAYRSGAMLSPTSVPTKVFKVSFGVYEVKSRIRESSVMIYPHLPILAWTMPSKNHQKSKLTNGVQWLPGSTVACNHLSSHDCSHFHPLPKRPPNSSWETYSTAWGRGGWWDVTGHANTPMPHQCSKPNALPSWNVAWRNHRPRKSSAWACRSLDQGSQSWPGETDQARPDEITHAPDLRRL